MRRVAYFVAVSAAAVACGCGGDDESVNNNADNYEGTEAEVASVVDDYGNAGRDGDGATICEEIFSDDLRSEIEKASEQSCPSEVEDNLPEGEFEVEIDSLDVGEDTATVAFTDQDDNRSVFQIERGDAGWRVTGITPAE